MRREFDAAKTVFVLAAGDAGRCVFQGVNQRTPRKVALAIGQALTDRKVHTSFAQIIGTPLYMSPEQAECRKRRWPILPKLWSWSRTLREHAPGIAETWNRRLTLKLLRDEAEALLGISCPRPSRKRGRRNHRKHKQKRPVRLPRTWKRRPIC